MSNSAKTYSYRFTITLLLLQSYSRYVDGQMDTLVFAQSQPPPMPPPSSNPPPSPSPVMGGTCRCVPTGTCMAGTSGGIDIRIVNTGMTTCSVGLQYCCTTGNPTGGNPTGNNSGLTDATCGLRKIPLTAQPAGTASYGAYPWQVALLTMSNAYIGSGVLLNDNHVLTVAHKVASYLNGGFKVRLGEWDAQSVSEQYPYQEYNVLKVFSHPSYNAQDLQNDVAVIRLNGMVPVTTSPGINTICMPSSLPPADTRCWVSGWGKNAFGPTGSYQSIMKEVDVPVLDQNDCEKRLRGTRLGQFFTLSKTSFVCAGGEVNKDACTGDGGSPLVCQAQGKWQLVGLVAWGIGCAMSGVPGVYVNVPNFTAWITQQVNQPA